MTQTQIINIKRIDKAKLNRIQNEFDEVDTGEKLKVISLGKIIYQKLINENDLSKNSNCPALNNCSEKIIDLKNFSIDCSMQPNERSYIKNLFDKFVFFLLTGYMDLQEKYLMDLLYLTIILDIQKNNVWIQKLIKKIDKRYYNKLWDVLLLIFNQNIKSYFEIASKLMDKNPEFLVDQYNQGQVVQKFLQLSSVQILKVFLKTLTKIITFKQEEQVNRKTFALIDCLYRYYLYKNNPKQYQTYSNQDCLKLMGNNIGSDVLFKMKDVQNNELINIVKKKQLEYQSERLKIQQEKQRLKQQTKQLEQNMVKLQFQQSQLAQQVEQIDRITKLGGNMNPSIDIVHHPQFAQSCDCKQTVKLRCGHQNCVQCGYIDICRFNVKNKSIQQYKIRCLKGKEPQNPCSQIWETNQYNTLGQILAFTAG